ncbi:MAG: DUF1846 family protein, partial [Candidatus Omnitrophica bacterium]|nr:DUF1846 family protein [Candidatus Omnitrophota bacterium]
GIINDSIVQEAARQEIIRRYFRYTCEYIMGFADKDSVQRIELLMEEFGLSPENRKVVEPARKAAQDAQQKNKNNLSVFCGAAIELSSGKIITGKNSNLMHSASSVVLNAIKFLAEIPDKIHLLAPNILESIQNLKKNTLDEKAVNLDLEETMIALSISAAANPAAQVAMEKLKELKNCEIHLTHIPTPGDEAGLRRLGLNITADPNFSSKNLFVV